MNDEIISAEHAAYLRSVDVGESVLTALRQLLVDDRVLLLIDANERSICFRFAMYLQQQFNEWTVDCEYNRDDIEPKRLSHLGLTPDSEDDEAKTVFPDVIVHHRKSKMNLLVIEFKKSTSTVSRQIDHDKLVGYKKQLGFDHALFVEVGTRDQASLASLQWF